MVTSRTHTNSGKSNEPTSTSARMNGKSVPEFTHLPELPQQRLLPPFSDMMDMEPHNRRCHDSELASRPQVSLRTQSTGEDVSGSAFTTEGEENNVSEGYSTLRDVMTGSSSAIEEELKRHRLQKDRCLTELGVSLQRLALERPLNSTPRTEPLDESGEENHGPPGVSMSRKSSAAGQNRKRILRIGRPIVKPRNRNSAWLRRFPQRTVGKQPDKDASAASASRARRSKSNYPPASWGDYRRYMCPRPGCKSEFGSNIHPTQHLRNLH